VSSSVVARIAGTRATSLARRIGADAPRDDGE
jgi:hypothetical protein